MISTVLHASLMPFFVGSFVKTWKKKNSSLLRYDLYFWLGKDSTPDEQGAAALLTVNMDDGVLGGNVKVGGASRFEVSSLSLLIFKF